jgi:hypothetical protein
MAINKRLLVKPPSTGITPSEHFGVVLYEGDGSNSHSINGGKFGAAFYGNGSNSYIDTGIKNTVGTRTLSVWIYYTGAPSSTKSIIKATSSGSAGYGLDLTTSLLRFQQNGEASVPSTSLSNLNTNAWNHIVGVIDGSTSTLYLNGSSVGTGTVTDAGSHNLYIGADNDIGTLGQVFEGKIDQVRIFDKALSSSEVSTLYAETASTVESLDPLSEDTTDTLQVLGDSSCIATYRFENNEDDLSGNYDGTGTAIQYAAGRYGQAADFNGSSSNVELPTGSPFNDSDTIKAISAWVKADTTSSRVYPFSIGSTTTDNQFFNFGYLGDSNNILVFMRNGSNSNQAYHSASTTTDTNWHHIVVQTTGSAVEIYLDGESQSVSSTYAGSGSASSWISYINYTGTVRANIGTNASYGPQYSNGKIDQVRFFNKTLSASEVTTLYNENSLVASYRFEGNANDDTRNYDGTASNVTYEYGLNFTPDLVWIHARTATDGPVLYDTTRGIYKRIYSHATATEQTLSTSLISFDTGGFSLGSSTNENRNGTDYVAWCFKAGGGTTSSNTDGSITSTVQANQDAGFSIVTWTGNSSNASIGHGLSSAPEMIMAKSRTVAQNWAVYHKDVGPTYWMRINGTNAKQDEAIWQDTTPSDSVFYVNNNVVINSGNSVAYCFHSVEGFSKFGSYTGTGGNLIVETGFEPAFLMVKRTDAANYDWYILDNKRNPVDYRNTLLRANSSNADDTVTNGDVDVKFLSNGFAFDDIPSTSGGFNASGGTYLYMAFAADPDTEAPTVAKSFTSVAYTGDGTSNRQIDLGFKPGLYWVKARGSSSCAYHNLFDIVRGGDKTLYSNVSSAEVTQQGCGYIQSFDDNGITYTGGSNGLSINNSGENFVAWAWKADDNEPTITGGPATAVYKFEDNLNDVGGNYNATASNVTYSTGKFNKSAVFNGTNAKVVFPSGTPFDASNAIRAISCWVKVPDSTARMVFYSASSSSNSQDYFQVDASRDYGILIGMRNGGSANSVIAYLGTGYITPNTWTHVVAQLSHYKQEFWINGVNQTANMTYSEEVGNISRTSWIGNISYDSSIIHNIGINRNSGTAYSEGEVDQMRLFSGPLSQLDIEKLYAEASSDNDNLSYVEPDETIISSNANAGFSIVKYEGNGQQNHKVSHGLSAAPEIVFIKNLDQAVTWQLFGSTFFDRMQFDTGGDDGNYPLSYSSTTITLPQGGQHANNEWNASGNNYIAYCWHSVSGYSKIGTYSGTGSAGNKQTLNFQPDLIIIKSTTNSAANWQMFDSVRGANKRLYPNLSNAEYTDSPAIINFLSDGFSFNSGDSHNNGFHDYIYMAFKIN